MATLVNTFIRNKDVHERTPTSHILEVCQNHISCAAYHHILVLRLVHSRIAIVWVEITLCIMLLLIVYVPTITIQLI